MNERLLGLPFRVTWAIGMVAILIGAFATRLLHSRVWQSFGEWAREHGLHEPAWRMTSIKKFMTSHSFIWRFDPHFCPDKAGMLLCGIATVADITFILMLLLALIG